jgi:hypothetical protein
MTPIGKYTTMTGTTIFHIANSKIVEGWNNPEWKTGDDQGEAVAAGVASTPCVIICCRPCLRID